MTRPIAGEILNPMRRKIPLSRMGACEVYVLIDAKHKECQSGVQLGPGMWVQVDPAIAGGGNP